jgi:hypothetical protein
VITIAIAVVLAAWTAVSVLNQVPAARRRLNGTLNSLCLLPAFSLFSPEPVDVDYHLLWRDHRVDDSFGPWHEIESEPANWWRGVWNPRGRDRSAMQTIVSSLSMLAGEVAPRCGHGEGILIYSLPYLALLNVVMAQPRAATAAARHFAIVESSGFGPDRRVAIGITSMLHRLEGA